MKYVTQDDHIIISLPITTPTGKVRVKRPVQGYAPEPVACRSVAMLQDDYLEWQISYNTDSLQEPSVLRDVVLNKPQGVRYGCELVRLIVEGRTIGILPEAQFLELRGLVSTLTDPGIEELERIQREEDPSAQTTLSRYGFRRHYLRVPNYLLTAPAYSVEIKIAHKQRAVGNQAMIYLNLPLRRCESQTDRPFVGRCAEKSEEADYIIDRENVGLVYDTFVAFALASLDYRNDLRMIFEKICSL